MLILTNTAGASAATPPASKTTLFVDTSGVPSTKSSGGTVTPLLTGPAAADAYQPLDTDLTGIAGLTYAADKSIYYTGSAWATYDLTGVGRTLLAATNQAAQRTALGAADDTAVVHLAGDESISGIKRFIGSRVEMGSNSPGFWLSENDGSFSLYQVLDGNIMQWQLRTANFGGTIVDIPFRMEFSTKVITTDYVVRPRTTNKDDLGTATFAYRNLYVQNAPVVTSDARLKTAPRALSSVERKAGSALARLPAIWAWLNGTELHAGPTVQAAIAVFSANGLDHLEYGFFTYDEWAATQAEYDGDGNEIVPAHAAGDKYGFRKEELLCFMVSALAAENDALDARLSALEAKV